MVKKIIYFNIAILIGLLILPACQKSPINGDLDGRWQIMEIERNGEVKEVKEDQLYYNFYMHVCNLSSYGEINPEANFNFENNTIELSFPYVNTETGMRRLNLFGIYSNPVEFEVLYLDKKKLIMENDECLLTLRKF